MVTEQHLSILQQQLSLHRSALQELYEQKATHEQAIAAIKATLQASGIPCDSSPYDGSDRGKRAHNLEKDEVQRHMERVLGGPAAMAERHSGS
jgi:hypothetical protein